MTFLQPVDRDIWLIEGEVVDFYSFPYPTRAVVIRLEGERLWVWSPVALREGLKRELDTLGTVAYLVSPNKLHHLYLAQWQQAYPHAELWGPQSTADKRADLSFSGILTAEAPSDWREEIGQLHFSGSPLLDEIVFFHFPSQTAILADLSENFSREFLDRHWGGWRTLVARLWKIVEGWGYPPLEWRLSWFRRDGARHNLQKLLSWNPEKVIMAHGVWQASDGAEYLRRCFRWLGG